MPGELKQLGDYYDPLKSGVQAMQVMQNQQHLGLQQKQIQQQQSNQEIDNAGQAAKTAITEDPAHAAPIYNHYLGLMGLPPVEANAFASEPQHFLNILQYPPGSPEFESSTLAIKGMGASKYKRSRDEFTREQSIEGFRQMSVAAGGSGDPAIGVAAEGSEATARQFSEAYIDPHKQAEAAMNKRTQAEQAGIRAELHPLIDMNLDVSDAVEELAKVTPKIAAAQATYQNDVQAKKGMGHAAEGRRVALAGDPVVAKYMENAAASVPKLTALLAEVKQEIKDAKGAAHHQFAGTKPQTPDDSLPISVGSLNALTFKKQFFEASLDLANDPTNPAKHEAVNQLAQKMDARAGELYQAHTALDVRRDAQQETARKAAYAEEYDRRVGLAQQDALQHGGKSTVAEFAAKYSNKQFQVKPTDVLGAFKDPDAPTTKIDIGDKTADQEYIRETRVTYNQLKQTQPLLDNIEKVKELIPKAKGFMGPGGEPLLEAAKFLNNRLGLSIDVAGIKSAEEVRTRIFFNLMDNLKKVDAQPSQMQQLVMQDSLGRLGTDPNALGNMLDAYGDALRSKVEIHNEDVTDAMKKGTHFPYNPVIKLRPKGTPSATAPSTMAPGPSSAPAVGQMDNGYIYKGGDPSKKENWEKTR